MIVYDTYSQLGSPGASRPFGQEVPYEANTLPSQGTTPFVDFASDFWMTQRVSRQDLQLLGKLRRAQTRSP